jgi:hypothetical protein
MPYGNSRESFFGAALPNACEVGTSRKCYIKARAWNDGAGKRAILDFVKATTDRSKPTFVRPTARIETFDQDGTPCIAERFIVAKACG